MPILTPEAALAKRHDLIDLGYCVIPDVLHGDRLDAMRRYTDEMLSEIPIEPRHRYQGSDIHVVSHRKWEQSGKDPRYKYESKLVEQFVDLPEAVEACRLIGLEGQAPDDIMIILSKPGPGPALYWHQDMMEWNHPRSAAPWPTRIFLSYYMVDTDRENGCLRVIPGTHRKRIDLHDVLPAAHEPEIQAADESHPAFMDHPDAIDVPMKSGDLVIGDARLLHAAWPNTTNQRRTLTLFWHSVFPFPHPPGWWEGEVPEVIRNADPQATYPLTRIPGEHLH